MEYLRDKLRRESSKVVAGDLDSAFIGDLDNGFWAVGDLDFTSAGAFSGCAGEIYKYYVVFSELAERLLWASRSINWSCYLTWLMSPLWRRPS